MRVAVSSRVSQETGWPALFNLRIFAVTDIALLLTSQPRGHPAQGHVNNIDGAGSFLSRRNGLYFALDLPLSFPPRDEWTLVNVEVHRKPQICGPRQLSEQANYLDSKSRDTEAPGNS